MRERTYVSLHKRVISEDVHGDNGAVLQPESRTRVRQRCDYVGDSMLRRKRLGAKVSARYHRPILYLTFTIAPCGQSRLPVGRTDGCAGMHTRMNLISKGVGALCTKLKSRRL